MRLTNAIRDDIVKSVCDAAINKRIAELESDIAAIELAMATLIQNKLANDLGLSNYNVLKRFSSLVAQYSSQFLIKSPSETFRIKIPDVCFIPTKEWQYVVNSEDYDGFSDLIKARNEAIELLRSARESKCDLAAETRKVLSSVSTTKQLLERWPDVVKYYDVKGKESNSLPACVDVSALDKMIETVQLQQHK